MIIVLYVLYSRLLKIILKIYKFVMKIQYNILCCDLYWNIYNDVTWYIYLWIMKRDADENIWKSVTCLKCKKVFCGKCGETPHKGQVRRYLRTTLICVWFFIWKGGVHIRLFVVFNIDMCMWLYIFDIYICVGWSKSIMRRIRQMEGRQLERG